MHGLALLQNVSKAWKMKIWKEEVIKSQKESIIIPTEAWPWVNKSELTGKSEEPNTSSLQKDTANEYLLKNIWEAISYVQLPPLWLHRQASLAGPGTLVISSVISAKDGGTAEKYESKLGPLGTSLPACHSRWSRNFSKNFSTSFHLQISQEFLCWPTVILNLTGRVILQNIVSNLTKLTTAKFSPRVFFQMDTKIIKVVRKRKAKGSCVYLLHELVVHSPDKTNKTQGI